jgi:hypothetical protein
MPIAALASAAFKTPLALGRDDQATIEEWVIRKI